MEILNFIIYACIIVFYLRLAKGTGWRYYFKWMLLGLILAQLIYIGPDSTADIQFYLTYPAWMAGYSWAEIFSLRDFFVPVCAKLVSYISVDPRVFATVMYPLFMLLLGATVKILFVGKTMDTTEIFLYPVAVLFIYPFLNFNAMRYGFATLFFMLSMNFLFLKSDRRFLWLMFLAPLTHCSYWIMMPVPLLAYFFRDKLNIAILFLIISYTLMGASMSYGINSFVGQYMSEAISENVSGYASESGLAYMTDRYAYEYSSSTISGKIFLNVYPIRNYIFGISLLIISLFGTKKVDLHPKEKKWLVLLLVTFSMANISNSVSNGDRFYHAATALIVYFLFYMQFCKTGVNDSLTKNVMVKKCIILIYFIAILVGAFMLFVRRGAYDFFK